VEGFWFLLGTAGRCGHAGRSFRGLGAAGYSLFFLLMRRPFQIWEQDAPRLQSVLAPFLGHFLMPSHRLGDLAGWWPIVDLARRTVPNDPRIATSAHETQQV
jgi:hypothetical protein